MPPTLLMVFLLLYLNFRRLTETMIIMLSLPFWAGGWHVADVVAGLQHERVAVAVGFIALAGRRRRDRRGHADLSRPSVGKYRAVHCEAPSQTHGEGPILYAAIMEGAVERVRPKMMTVTAIMAGLPQILWSHGTGSKVMGRIAVPMIGGMVTSTTCITWPGDPSDLRAGEESVAADQELKVSSVEHLHEISPARPLPRSATEFLPATTSDVRPSPHARSRSSSPTTGRHRRRERRSIARPISRARHQATAGRLRGERFPFPDRPAAGRSPPPVRERRPAPGFHPPRPRHQASPRNPDRRAVRACARSGTAEPARHRSRSGIVADRRLRIVHPECRLADRPRIGVGAAESVSAVRARLLPGDRRRTSARASPVAPAGSSHKAQRFPQGSLCRAHGVVAHQDRLAHELSGRSRSWACRCGSRPAHRRRCRRWRHRPACWPSAPRAASACLRFRRPRS